MKRIGLLSLIFLLFPMLTGCWDSIEIEKRATVLALAIDQAEPGALEEEGEINHLRREVPVSEEKMIRLTAQVAVPGRIPLGPETGGGGGEQEPVWILSVVGHTLEDAILNLQQELADEIFLGHLRVIVISNELAEKGVDRFNDILRRNPEVRRTTWVVVSKERASRYMEVQPELEKIPTLYLNSMIENAVELGKFPNDFIGLFWRAMSSKGRDAYLPYLEIKRENNIQIAGLAYFKGDQKAGIINPKQIGLFMGLTGHGEGGYGDFIPIPGTDEQILVHATKRKTKIKTAIKGGKPYVKVKIRYEVEIDEKDQEKIKISDSRILEKLEKERSKGVITTAKSLIKKLQEEESDIFGFGEYIRAKHSGYWNKEVGNKKKWQEIYKDIDVQIECAYNIRRVGMKAK